MPTSSTPLLASVSSGFATPAELTAVRELAQAVTTWRILRNRYHFCSITPGTVPALRGLEARAHTLVCAQDGDVIDSFLIDYGPKDFIEEHVDSNSYRRLNLLVVAPHDPRHGFRVQGQLVTMQEGDAVVFQPSTVWHSVDPVSDRRLIWSYGVARRAMRKIFVPLKE